MASGSRYFVGHSLYNGEIMWRKNAKVYTSSQALSIDYCIARMFGRGKLWQILACFLSI